MRMGVVTYEQLSNMSVVSILISSNLFNGKGNPALWFMVYGTNCRCAGDTCNRSSRKNRPEH